MERASDLLRELVAVRSDTGTAYEVAMGEKIYEIIRRHPYFQEHPQLCGMDSSRDRLGRPIVWALRKGKSDKTVILSAHYDAVEIDSYGRLKPYALDPDRLKEKMMESPLIDEEMKEILKDPGWMVGRGAADCKSGIASSLYVLFESDNWDGNILFLVVCDEENLSAGARQAIAVFKELKERFHLDYRFAAITEPDSYKDPDTPFSLAEGCVGKLLPIVVAKGVVAHAALMLYGLNSSYIIAEVVRRMELNAAFHSCDQNRHTHPSSTLFMRDLKDGYDISLPEYSAAAFNVLLHQNANIPQHIETIRGYCEEALKECVQVYEKVYGEMADCGAVDAADMQHYVPEALTVQELKDRLKQRYSDFSLRLEKIEGEIQTLSEKSNLTLQQLSIEYVRRLINLYESKDPVVVVGIAPPYYPPVSNEHKNEDFERILNELAESMNRDGDVGSFRDPYNAGPTDLCYMFCNHLDDHLKVMENLCIPKDIYDIDFRTLSELALPGILMGATGKDVHKVTERVWIEDVDRRVPEMIEKIMKLAFQ